MKPSCFLPPLRKGKRKEEGGGEGRKGNRVEFTTLRTLRRDVAGTIGVRRERGI